MAFAATATRLIAKYGRDFIIRRVTAGSYDPTGPGASPDTVTETTVRGLKLDPGTFQTPQGLVVRDKATLLIAARQADGTSVIKPDSNDKIHDPLYGTDYEAGKVTAIDVDGGEIAWQVELAS